MSPWSGGNSQQWIQDFINCVLKGIIYLIQCSCGKLYVDLSSRAVQIRITEHCSKIKHKIMAAPLVAHFVEAGHDFHFCVTAKLKKTPYCQIDLGRTLLHMETFWIHTLNTITPKGLSQPINFTGFL